MRIPRPVNDVVLWLIARRWTRLHRSLLGLEVRGRRTGRRFRFPVQYAEDKAGLVVLPGHPETKSWWRNLTGGPHQVEILLGGRWQPATAEVIEPGHLAHAVARTTYRERFPRTEVLGVPVVRLHPVGQRTSFASRVEEASHA
jgi:deazaflavin-dependent oxidoreductase (nitroreductase family)